MSSELLRIACAQMSSSTDVEKNMASIEELIADAARSGADLIALPENAPHLAPSRDKLARSESLDGPQVSRVREWARRSSVHVLLGSFTERVDDRFCSNTSVLIDREGRISAVYRKVHLFDVNVDAETSFRESATVVPGPPEPVVADVEGWKIGLSICYDLRFPEMYRRLVDEGAEILMVPAAFTLRTGMDHWHVLLRARAIENQCYVVAPAQVGRCYGTRESYGHALIASPWGGVLADREAGDGNVYATAERQRLESVRTKLPCLSHRRF